MNGRRDTVKTAGGPKRVWGSAYHLAAAIGPGMRKPAACRPGPMKYLGSGLQVEGEEVEPGRIVEAAAEEEVGVIALGDVGVLVHEDSSDRPDAKTARASTATAPASQNMDVEDCGEFDAGERCSGGVSPICERSLE